MRPDLSEWLVLGFLPAEYDGHVPGLAEGEVAAPSLHLETNDTQPKNTRGKEYDVT